MGDPDIPAELLQQIYNEDMDTDMANRIQQDMFSAQTDRNEDPMSQPPPTKNVQPETLISNENDYRGD